MRNFIKKINTALSSEYAKDEIRFLTILLLEKRAHIERNIYYCDKDIKIPDTISKQLESDIERLKNREPWQYITGECEFYGLNFYVNKNVLIPRPETEELTDIIIKKAAGRPRILDIGTGSGAIAVSLAKNIHDSEVYAWDISEKALETAKRNAKRNNCKVIFSQTDILKYDPENKFSNYFDLIVSNPPYVCNEEKKEMEKNVLDYEPHTALFVNDMAPLIFYEKISGISKKILKDKGKIFFEINSRFGKETTAIIKNYGYENVELIQDISGKDRFIKATLK